MTNKVYEFVLTKRIGFEIEDAENEEEARDRVQSMYEDGDFAQSFDRATPDFEVTAYNKAVTKWYCLDTNGDMQFVGEFEDFDAADEHAGRELPCSPMWLVDEETARAWLSKLREMLDAQ